MMVNSEKPGDSEITQVPEQQLENREIESSLETFQVETETENGDKAKQQLENKDVETDVGNVQCENDATETGDELKEETKIN